MSDKLQIRKGVPLPTSSTAPIQSALKQMESGDCIDVKKLPLTDRTRIYNYAVRLGIKVSMRVIKEPKKEPFHRIWRVK
jgi:hypothetical protein